MSIWAIYCPIMSDRQVLDFGFHGVFHVLLCGIHATPDLLVELPGKAATTVARTINFVLPCPRPHRPARTSRTQEGMHPSRQPGWARAERERLAPRKKASPLLHNTGSDREEEPKAQGPLFP